MRNRTALTPTRARQLPQSFREFGDRLSAGAEWFKVGIFLALFMPVALVVEVLERVLGLSGAEFSHFDEME